MDSLWILCFSILIFFRFQFCNSTYIFTQYNFGTSVCKSEIYDENCPEGTPTIFNGPKKNVPMNLGFLNKTSDIFYDGYNMTEFGFPIFFEYFLDNEKLNVNLIIANGKQSKTGNGLYYYVSLIDDEGICGKTRPTIEKETLSGGLYLNQRKAEYAYYIYQSPDSTCILTIEFDDLFQGDYETKKPKKIKPQEINLISSKVKGFYYPFFTIDTILGTAVFLTFKDDKLSAVHYKIDENDLTNFKKVLSLSLTLDSKSDGTESILWYFENLNDYRNSNPTFTSFGKSTFLFFAIEEYSNVIGIWSPKYAHATLLDIDDNQRRFYFLDSDYLNYFTMDYFEEDTEYETFSYLRSNSSSTSFIHLNRAYFLKNQESEKVSDFHLFVMAFIRLCIIGFLIALITILSLCILATSLTSLVVVLDNVDYQLGLIRNADIFNPLPSTTNQPVEAVSSDPKLAPHPSPLMEERSTTSSSVIWCNNLFITDEMDTNHEMESDETQSLTSYTSFDGNYSIA